MATNVIQRKTIVIEVDAGTAEKSLRAISGSLGRMEKSVKGVQDSFSSLRSLFTGFAGASLFGFGVRDLAQMADSFTLLESRINVFTGSATKTAEIMKDLTDLANETKVGITDIAEVFSRVQVATSRLNITSDAQIAIAKVLQNSFRLSGASAQEASSSTIQFTQALSSGQLRGQELRSMLEGNAVLAGVFSEAAEKAGKSVFKFAEEGKFTNDVVFKLLAENFDSINARASTMAQTFDQSLIIAMNKFREKIAQVNKEAGLSSGFAKFVNFVVDKSDVVLSFLSKVVTLQVSGGATNSLSTYFGTMEAFFSTVSDRVSEAVAALERFRENGLEKTATFFKIFGTVVKIYMTNLAIGIIDTFSKVASFLNKDFADKLKGASSTLKEELTVMENSLADLEKRFNKESVTEKNFFSKEAFQEASNLRQALEGAAESAKKVGSKTVQERIGALTVAFNRGAVGIAEFNEQLELLTREELGAKLKAGTITLEKFQKEIRDMKMDAFARELDGGLISIDQFNEKIRLFKIEELNQKFRDGKIAVSEFTNELVKLQNTGLLDKETYTMGMGAGISNYIEGIGTLSSQIADATKRAFSSLEDSLLEFTKNGRQDWAQFTQGILDDLTRIAIRTSIVNPLAGGLLGLITPSAANMGQGSGSFGQSPIAGEFAAGGAFNSSGVQFFAKGGIVDSPTLFGFNRGIGMAGEAGPEAILPLSRSADGSLGVKSSSQSLVVNVINNSGAEVSASESVGPDGSRTLELVIESKVKEGIARGAFDRSFQQSFGLNRRGI